MFTSDYIFSWCIHGKLCRYFTGGQDIKAVMEAWKPEIVVYCRAKTT
jgi:hypothetical protein